MGEVCRCWHEHGFHRLSFPVQGGGLWRWVKQWSQIISFPHPSTLWTLALSSFHVNSQGTRTLWGHQATRAPPSWWGGTPLKATQILYKHIWSNYQLNCGLFETRVCFTVYCDYHLFFVLLLASDTFVGPLSCRWTAQLVNYRREAESPP